MSGISHKFRFKKGNMEFEVEGSPAFVEEKLAEFSSLLGTAPAEAPKKRRGKKRGRKAAPKKRAGRKPAKVGRPAKIEKPAKVRKPAKRGRRAKRTGAVATVYSAEAAASLKAFIRKQKPKTLLQTIVAIGKHHLEFFKKDAFTNKDLKAGGLVLKKKFKNLPLTLIALRKKNLIQKVAKATWKAAA